MGPVLYFGIHSLFLCVWHVFYDSAFGFLTIRRKTLRGTKQLPLTACGGMAKSARCCSPRPSRRFAKRAMEQWRSSLSRHHCLLASTRCGRLSVLLYSPSWSCFALARSLLDVSRLLGLTLRPSAPCLRCHRDSLTRWRLALAHEAARVASSSSSHLFF